MLSVETYKEFVLPYHKRIFDELTPQGCSRGMHLCGDAQRFFPVLEKELNVKSFDTGFPLDFGRLYEELSSDVRIMGGPPIGLILNGTPDDVKTKAESILKSGVMEKSRYFVLREANALAPGTPIDNVNAIYEAAEMYGYYK